MPLGYCYLYGIGTTKDLKKAREYFQTYFNRLNHTPEARIYHSNSVMVDLDYLLGLTYYFENSPEAIKLLEASLKNDTFYISQRADLLYKLASCYRGGKCGVINNDLIADKLFRMAVEIAKDEIDATNLTL